LTVSKKDDIAWLAKAYQAAKQSKDPSTQIGAVLVANHGIAGWAVNEIHGLAAHPERGQRPLKYKYASHAEAGVIHDAARRGFPTKGLTMYATWAACSHCALAIVNAGVRRLVRHKHPLHATATHWAEELEHADRILAEGGVEVVDVEHQFGVTFRFNGEVVEA
jgi:dCMP deaminase